MSLADEQSLTEEEKAFLKKAKPYFEVGATLLVGSASGAAYVLGGPILGAVVGGALSGFIAYVSTGGDLEDAQWAAAGGFVGGLLGGALGRLVSGTTDDILYGFVGSTVFSMVGLKLLGPDSLAPRVAAASPAAGVGGAGGGAPWSPPALPVRWVGRDVFAGASPAMPAGGLLMPDQDHPDFPAEYVYPPALEDYHAGAFPRTVRALWESFGDPPGADDVPKPIGVAKVRDLGADESSRFGDEYERMVVQLGATYRGSQQTHQQVAELAQASAAISREGRAAIGQLIVGINQMAPVVPPPGTTETKWIMTYIDKALKEGRRVLDEALSAQQRVAAQVDARTQALGQEREVWQRRLDEVLQRQLGATDRAGGNDAGPVELFDQPVVALGAGGGDVGGDDRVDLGPPGVAGGDETGEGAPLGDLRVDAPGQEAVPPVAGQMPIAAADARRGQQGAQLLLGDPRGGNLGAGLLGNNLGPHIGEPVVRQALSRPLQSPTVGPLRVARASALIPQVPGDASAHVGEDVVGERDEVAMMHDPWGVGQRGAPRRSVEGAGSMAT